MKNEKGITLIALVITIIVLLILAGVSIAMITDENGILGRATGAAKTSRIAEDKEAAVMDLNAAYTAYMEQKYVNTAGSDDSKTFLTFLDEAVDDYLDDTEHYTYHKNGDHKIVTKHQNANDKTEEITVSNDGGFTGSWTETAE